ncbi:MAG: hypothetical protein JWR19_3633 [Pedosphaera sp.]|nr:hypothetical protein [Pedosphaera sp.]
MKTQEPSVESAAKVQCVASLVILKRFSIFLAVGILAVCSARASGQNLLVNGDFNAGSSGWSTFTYGGGYVSFEIPGKLVGTTATTWPSGWPQGAGTNAAGTGPLYDGTLQLTCGAAGGNAGGFAWQTIAAAPNVPYTLTIQAAAENWWLPTGQIRLWFLDVNNAVITSNFVSSTDSLHNGSNGGLGDKYDVGVPYQNWTNSATSPAGTKFLKVELCNPVGTGSAWFDNAYLTAPINPPVISNLYPNGSVLLQATNKLSFIANSAAPINGSGISVILNGVDISGSLVITGSGTTNVSVSYSGLQTNQAYTAVINVTDTVNLSSILNVSFDTYVPSFVWEAEDYDYGSGQSVNNPILSGTPTSGSYFGVTGTEGIDFHNNAVSGPEAYRPDTMSTAVSGDVTRQNFINAGVSDYIVGYFDGAGFGAAGNVGLSTYRPQEWVNYTRTFAAGTYNIYARIASGNGPTANLPVSKVVSGQGTSTQTTTNLGFFNFPAVGWGSYNYIPMQDKFGNPVAVTLSGTTTLRVSAGSGANMNFFMLLPADSTAPTITSVYPDGGTLLQGTNKLTFTVSSASHSIAQSNVLVTLNGVTNSSLTFSGSASSWNVSVPLALNVTNYTAVITVTDNVGNNHSTTLYFDTFNPASYDIEAENWDFNGGQLIDNPVITSAAAPNSYFDQVGTAADEYPGDVATPPTADYHYRQNDSIATSVCNDTPTRALLAAQLTDSLAFNYNVAWWATNGWLNYSHNYPAGNYHVYARLAGSTGLTNQIQLDKISGPSSTNYLGTFTEVGRGYNAYDWIPLVNTNSGLLATVNLGGLATLHTTSITGNVNPNSYLLVPLTPTPVPLLWIYSGGVLTLSWTDPAFHLQAQTNSMNVGISTNWADYPGGATSPVNVPANPSAGAVFFRLSN